MHDINISIEGKEWDVAYGFQKCDFGKPNLLWCHKKW